MKKSLVALAALSVIGAASAQSTVTLYGVADAYVGSIRIDGTTQTKVQSGGESGSRWGLKVNEDLGGGLTAFAAMESGFDIDTGTSGQGGALFGRGAFVGLKSASFGSFAMGAQNSMMYDVNPTLSAQGMSVFDAINSGQSFKGERTKIGAWQGYSLRTGNSLKYVSPSFSGFSVGAVYGLGENKSAGISTNDSYSIGGTYANGPIYAALVYQEDANGDRSANNGRNTTKNTLLGGSYDFGMAKLAGGYNEYRKVTDGNNGPKAKEYFVGVSAPFGATTLAAQYARSKFSGVSADDSFGINANYAFSKRTDSYVGFNETRIKSQGDTTIKNRIFAVGMRHKF